MSNEKGFFVIISGDGYGGAILWENEADEIALKVALADKDREQSVLGWCASERRVTRSSSLLALIDFKKTYPRKLDQFLRTSLWQARKILKWLGKL